MQTQKTPTPPAWPLAGLDPIQARNHLVALAAVQRIARQAQAARVEAALRAWRSA